MDLAEAIRSSRATREFADRDVEKDTIRSVLDLARRTGSGHNIQPWSFVVLRNREQLDELASFGEYTTPLTKAPAGIALVIEESESDYHDEFRVFDCGRIAQTIMLVATERGLGTVPQGIRDREAAEEFLSIPAGRRLFLVLAMGYPADRPDDEIEGKPKEEELDSMGRKPIDEIIHWERFDE